MALLTQSMNQFSQSPILGQVDMIPSPNVIPAQILPTSSATAIQVGSAMKLVAGVSGAILVDVQTGPTDAAVFGVIAYNERQNIYKPGDFCELACAGTYIYLRSGGAIARGDNVSTVAATTSTDPIVSTDVVASDFITGKAVDVATGALQLVRIQIAPSQNPAA